MKEVEWIRRIARRDKLTYVCPKGHARLAAFCAALGEKDPTHAVGFSSKLPKDYRLVYRGLLTLILAKHGVLESRTLSSIKLTMLERLRTTKEVD